MLLLCMSEQLLLIFFLWDQCHVTMMTIDNVSTTTDDFLGILLKLAEMFLPEVPTVPQTLHCY